MSEFAVLALATVYPRQKPWLTLGCQNVGLDKRIMAVDLRRVLFFSFVFTVALKPFTMKPGGRQISAGGVSHRTAGLKPISPEGDTCRNFAGLGEWIDELRLLK